MTIATTSVTVRYVEPTIEEELQVVCPICDMKLPMWVVPGMVGKVTTLCVSKTCGKIRVTVDTRNTVVR